MVVMEIRLRPELAELVKKDVERGPYATVEQFVDEAVSMMHERELWLAQNRAAISAKIEEGFAAAERGELMDADAARSALADRKKLHLGDEWK